MAHNNTKIVSIVALIILITALSFPSSHSHAFSDIKPLGLFEAIQISLENNRNIHAMLRAVEKSEYLHRAASKEMLPTVSMDYIFMGFPRIPEMELGEYGAGDSEESSFPLTEHTSFIWGTHVKMPIYTGGAIQYKKSIARLGIDVSEMRLLETKADLIQQVTINYFDVLKLQNHLKVSVENLTRFTAHESVTQKYFDAQLVAKNTLLEIQAKRARAQQELIVVEKNLRLAKAALNVVMGIEISTRFYLADISGRGEAPYTAQESFEIAQNYNPSLVAFTYLRKRAEKVMELEKTGARPSIMGNFSYYRHGKTPALEGDDYFSNDILVGMVVAKWEIFDWFKTRDRVNARKMELEALIDRWKLLEDRIRFDILEAHLSMEAAKNKFLVAAQEIEYAEENYRIARLRYEERVGRSTEVNDGLVLLKEARFSYYTAFYDYNVALAKLNRIMGINLETESR